MAEARIKITEKPTTSSVKASDKVFVNVNGELVQVTVDNVVNNSTLKTTVDNTTKSLEQAINNMANLTEIVNSKANGIVCKSTGSPILLTDSAKGVAIEFNAKGRSTQDGEPTPTEPITPKSNGDMGYFDGELLQGAYSSSNGEITTNATYLCSKNFIPCNVGDEITLKYATSMRVVNLLYYDESKTFITSSTAQTNVDKHTATAPTNAKYFKFNISESSTAITVSDAKHICVTINDKYALIVDSKGKNEILTKEVGTYGGIYDIDEDRKVKVSGTITARAFFPIGTARLIGGKRYRLTGTPNGITIPLYLHIQGAVIDKGNGISFTPTTTKDYTIGIYVSSDEAVTATNILFEPMLRFEEITDATYEPYKKSRKYIPISSPLRGIGEVTDVARLTEGKVERKFTKVVFDGSDDEGWSIISTNPNTNLFRVYPPKKAKVSPIICSHFVYYSGSNEDFEHTRLSAEANPVLAMWVNKTRIATIDEWKTWLQANPITVIYELAESITESIEPVDVDTFEGVTQISVSDDAEMEVEYPADTKTYIDNKISETVATLYSAILNA